MVIYSPEVTNHIEGLIAEIARLQKFKESVFNYWSDDDIIAKSLEMGTKLTDDEIDSAKYIAQKRWDTGSGFCWDDLENAIQEVIDDRKHDEDD